MQIKHIGHAELADLLVQSTVLDTVDHSGQRTYVLHFDDQDILAISPCNGGAIVVYPDATFDAESGGSGGSVHDHARAILRDAYND